MAIIVEPFYSVVLAYRPIKFVAEITVDSTAYVAENAVVGIYKNTVLVATVRYKVSSTTPVTPPNIEYTFDIDIQKFCQDSLAPNTDAQKPLAFADSGSGMVVCTDGYAGYNISVTYEGINQTTGFLEDMGILADISGVFAVFYSSRQHLEPLNLTDFYGTYGSADGKCLTKNSTEIEIGLSENAYLAISTPIGSPLINSMRVRLFNSAGAQIHGATSDSAVPVYAAQDSNLMSANVGAVSLQAVSYTSGSVNFSDPSLAYYTVDFGYKPVGVYIRHTNIFTFTIVSRCGNRNLRLHWLNLLGGVDSYTFNSEKDLQIKTNSETGRKSLEFAAGDAVPNSVSDFGGFKYNSQASTSYKLKSKFLTNDNAIWLQDLLFSPKVYAELDGDLVPVIVEDTDQSIFRQNGRIRYEISVKLANDYIIQRI